MDRTRESSGACPWTKIVSRPPSKRLIEQTYFPFILGRVSVQCLYVPWDIEVARLNFGANCGPVACATILGQEVCRTMRYFSHFEDGCWTNLTRMKQAFGKAGYRTRVVKQELPDSGVALVQWLGPWTSPHFFSSWSLLRTHWVAVQGNYIFDHTHEEWLTLQEWETRVVPRFLERIPQAAGWAIKYGIEVSRSGNSNGVTFGSTTGEFSFAV